MVSTVLAEALGWERADFKLHVRRLKELGLTISLDVGYRLSPRGAAYLAMSAGLPARQLRLHWPGALPIGGLLILPDKT